MKLEQEIQLLVEQGRKIEAVKLYMNYRNCSLADAKRAVEALERGAELPQPAAADAALEAEVLRWLRDGQKIKAVKLYRDRTGASLMESKQAVESLAARHGIEMQAAGCSGLAVMLAVALVLIAGAMALMTLTQ